MRGLRHTSGGGHDIKLLLDGTAGDRAVVADDLGVSSSRILY